MPQSTAFFKYKVCNLAHIFVKTYSLCGVLFNRFGIVPVYANKADIAEKYLHAARLWNLLAYYRKTLFYVSRALRLVNHCDGVVGIAYAAFALVVHKVFLAAE